MKHAIQALALLLASGTAQAQLTLIPVGSIDITPLAITGVGGMSINPSTGNLWITGTDTDILPLTSFLFELDPATGALISTANLSLGFPALEAGPDALALNPVSGNISVFSRFLRDVAGLVAPDGMLITQYPAAEQSLAATYDALGQLTTLTDTTFFDTPRLLRWDPLTGAILSSLDLPVFDGRPVAMTLDPVTGNLFTLSSQNILVELDPVTGVILSETDVDEFFNFLLGAGAAFSSDGSLLYLSKGNDEEILVFERAQPGIEVTCQPANPHSSGGPVTLANSDFSGPGVMHLEATAGPPGEFAYFLVSPQLVDPGVPVAGGVLCLGSPVARYSPASGIPQFNSIGQFNAAGVLQNLVGTSTVMTGFDVPTGLPGPIGGTITSGSTFHFQLWFRDGQASNFSDAASVTFP